MLADLPVILREELPVTMRAVSTWSLHRTLGRSVAPDSATFGGPFMEGPAASSGVTLLDLPAELRRHGYDTLQIVHFHLPSREPKYLDRLRTALAEARVELDTLLIDDGDLTHPERADEAEAWVGEWLDAAVALGARRARVVAGRTGPTPEVLQRSARRLARLAEKHPEVRIVIENWMELLPDADAVQALFRETGDGVGLLIDLGNWSGPTKYDELARIAPLAETCHAKCRFTQSGPDAEDFRRSLTVLKDADYRGPLALIYDGPDGDEWAMLDVEHELVRGVFG